MIPHGKYDYIQVENILQAANGLIEELSYVNQYGETVLHGEIEAHETTMSSIIKAINILKHQLEPSHPHGTKEA